MSVLKWPEWCHHKIKRRGLCTFCPLQKSFIKLHVWSSFQPKNFTGGAIRWEITFEFPLLSPTFLEKNQHINFSHFHSTLRPFDLLPICQLFSYFFDKKPLNFRLLLSLVFLEKGRGPTKLPLCNWKLTQTLEASFFLGDKCDFWKVFQKLLSDIGRHSTWKYWAKCLPMFSVM